MSKIEWERIDVLGQAPGPFTLRHCAECGEKPCVTMPTHDTTRSECKCRVMIWTPKGVAIYDKP